MPIILIFSKDFAINRSLSELDSSSILPSSISTGRFSLFECLVNEFNLLNSKLSAFIPISPLYFFGTCRQINYFPPSVSRLRYIKYQLHGFFQTKKLHNFKDYLAPESFVTPVLIFYSSVHQSYHYVHQSGPWNEPFTFKVFYLWYHFITPAFGNRC